MTSSRIAVQLIERIYNQFRLEEGFGAGLCQREYRQKISRKKIDGDVEALLIAICCGDRPLGRTRWTLSLLDDKIVELGCVENISHTAIRQRLIKTKL